MIVRWTPQIKADVYLREDTSDLQTWIDAFEVGYHVPPPINPEAVLDLGANIGLTALHYSAMWPEACVCAVEMDQENFDMCVRNFPGVSIHAAVGVRAGAGYYAQEGWEARYSLTRPGDTFVRVLTIGQIIDECLPTASGIFCKMDIEGAEWDIFAGGGIDARITHLLVELHGPDIPKEEVKRGKRMLANSGFETTRHVIHPSALWAVR